MEEREYLARVAMIPVPITKDGSTRLFQDSRPADGSMPIFTEKNWIPISPSQKPGAESPQMAKNIPPRSLGHEFFTWLRGLSAAEHIRRIRLETEPENERAAALYARMGFSPLGYCQMFREEAT